MRKFLLRLTTASAQCLRRLCAFFHLTCQTYSGDLVSALFDIPRYSHPLIVVMLKSLFKSILLHDFVPDKFGTGISIPLIKDKSDDAK